MATNGVERIGRRTRGENGDDGEARRWTGFITEWEHSGLTQGDFCERRGLSLHVFRAWRYGRHGCGNARRTLPSRSAASRCATTPLPAFVPVRVVERSEPDAPGGASPRAEERCGVEIAVTGGRVIRVRPGFDAETLARVLAVLDGRTC